MELVRYAGQLHHELSADFNLKHKVPLPLRVIPGPAAFPRRNAAFADSDLKIDEPAQSQD